MIVAITGGTGFIGRRLARRHLSQGDVVRVLSRGGAAEPPKGVRVYRGDLAQGRAEPLADFLDGADVLYHCAGETADRARMRALHVDGTARLLEAAKGRVRHWVQLSSVGVYGPRAAGIVTEATPWHPRGEYEVTKAESDKLVTTSAPALGLTWSVLRPSIVFGVGMPNRSLCQMIRMIEKGLFFFIGRPAASANYIHVENVVDGLVLCARLPAARGRAYNLSDHRTLEQFVGAIARALGQTPPSLRLPEAPVRLAARAGEILPGWPLKSSRVEALVGRAIYSTDLIRQELGYSPSVSVEDGLKELVAARS